MTEIMFGGRGHLSGAPVPAWVVHEPYARPDKPEDAFIHSGLARVLDDVQVDLAGPQEAWNFRRANHVVTQSGAEAAAHVAADFDPRYQRMEIHYVRVLRGDQAFDRTRLEAFELLRRERDLERRILDGRLSASLMVPDVRPGDVVETCLTIYGSNPVLKGHYSNWVVFDSPLPLLELRYRLRHASGRKLSLLPLNGAPAPKTAEAGGIVQHEWHAERSARFDFEPFSPPWLIQGAVTQLSDCADWAEVAGLFASLYDVETIPQDLQQSIDQLAQAHATPAARAAEALRFVQKKLRYLALSFGDGGLMPRSIEEICSTGYGDCKDAARLFVTVARRLGLDASPALVSTTHGPILNTLLPSAGVFNHCIVRVRIDGKTYWLDPTIRSQSGALDRVVQLYSGYALPLAAETTALEAMTPIRPEVVVEVDETVKFGPFVGTPAEFERKNVYTSWRADMLRDAIANQGLANIAESGMKELASAWPVVEETAPIRVEDDPGTNTLTTVEIYKLPNCWRPRPPNRAVFETHDSSIGRELNLLSSTQRRSDIYLGRPRILRRFVHFHMPKNWSCNTWDTTMEMPGLTYRSKLSRKTKRLLMFSQMVAISAETAPAKGAERYNEIVRAIRTKCDISLWAVNDQGEIKRPKGSGSDTRRLIAIIVWIVVMLGLAVAGVLSQQ